MAALFRRVRTTCKFVTPGQGCESLGVMHMYSLASNDLGFTHWYNTHGKHTHTPSTRPDRPTLFVTRIIAVWLNISAKAVHALSAPCTVTASNEALQGYFRSAAPGWLEGYLSL